MKALLSSTDSPSSPPEPAPPPLSPDEVVKLAFLVARRRVDAHSARDIAQETWLKVAVQAEREADWSVARARAWVRTVAANAALDLLRREQPGPLPEVGAQPAGRSPDPAEALELEELGARDRAQARALLAKLSRPDRELLAGRVLEGRSYAELAEQFGLKASSLRARFSRLRASLQKGDL